MSRILIAFVATLIAFGAVDFVWLAFLAKDLYRNGIGHLMADSPNWIAAALFYLLFIAGLLYFAVLPGLAADDWMKTLVPAALFGFFCYATYDLTNWATLRDWPASIVAADLAWGTFVSAAGASAGFFITRALTR
jgi:uncharacterized membrane protein